MKEVLHLGLSLLLDPQEKEWRLYFLFDFCEFGRGNFAMVRMIGWCCLLRLLDTLVQTYLVGFPFENDLLLSNNILRRLYFLPWFKRIIFQAKVNEVFKALGVLSIWVVEWTEVRTMVVLWMKNGGKEEVLGGSLVFIHNNYKITKIWFTLWIFYIYSQRPISAMICFLNAGTNKILLTNLFVIIPDYIC